MANRKDSSLESSRRGDKLSGSAKGYEVETGDDWTCVDETAGIVAAILKAKTKTAAPTRKAPKVRCRD